MSGVLILGAGGHGKVVADILLAQGVRVRGFLDDDRALWGEERLGVPVLGGIAAYCEFAPTGLILGMGGIAARQAVVARIGPAAHDLWCTAIHPHATVAKSVQWGRGVAVMARAVVNPDAILGDHCVVNTAATVDHDCVIGEYAHIGPGAHLAGGIRVGRAALIGVGASVTPWLTIGDGAVVGAGAVVVGDVPSDVTVKGVPARQ